MEYNSIELICGVVRYYLDSMDIVYEVTHALKTDGGLFKLVVI